MVSFPTTIRQRKHIPSQLNKLFILFFFSWAHLEVLFNNNNEITVSVNQPEKLTDNASFLCVDFWFHSFYVRQNCRFKKKICKIPECEWVFCVWADFVGWIASCSQCLIIGILTRWMLVGHSYDENYIYVVTNMGNYSEMWIHGPWWTQWIALTSLMLINTFLSPSISLLLFISTQSYSLPPWHECPPHTYTSFLLFLSPMSPPVSLSHLLTLVPVSCTHITSLPPPAPVTLSGLRGLNCCKNEITFHPERPKTKMKGINKDSRGQLLSKGCGWRGLPAAEIYQL